MKTFKILTTWALVTCALHAGATRDLLSEPKAALSCFDELTQKPSQCMGYSEKMAIRKWIKAEGLTCFGKDPKKAAEDLIHDQPKKDLLCFFLQEYPERPWRKLKHHLVKRTVYKPLPPKGREYLYEDPPLGTLL